MPTTNHFTHNILYTQLFILYYGAGYVNVLQLLMFAGYNLYEHVNTQQLISE